jgi:hypothetical protein
MAGHEKERRKLSLKPVIPPEERFAPTRSEKPWRT